MNIHIVQKGDTLWKLAQQYQVDFEELKKANAHLADPDQIMPGMKIKIPTKSVPVKKEMPKSPVKEAPKKEMPKPHMPEQPKIPPKYQPSPIPQAPSPHIIQGVKQSQQQQMNMNVNVYKHEKHEGSKKEEKKEKHEKKEPVYTMPSMPEMPKYYTPQPYPFMMGHHPCHYVPWTPIMPGYGFSPCGAPCPPMPYPHYPVQEGYPYPAMNEYASMGNAHPYYSKVKKENHDINCPEDNHPSHDYPYQSPTYYGYDDEEKGKQSPWINKFYDHQREEE